MSDLDALLEAAEPIDAREVGSLVERLMQRRQVGGARAADRRAIDPRALAALSIRGVTQDSRRVAPGMLFVAIAGAHVDGHDRVAEAAELGAAASLVEHAVDVDLPQLVVRSTRVSLAETAAWWYGDPSHELAVVGITGTDGKTTTAFLAAAALDAAGLRAGLLGTVATGIGGERWPNAGHVTTPEAPELQRLLRAMVRAGDRSAVVETTSHGLALRRVDAIAYDAAILTNITHEHLELHGTWEAYRNAKLSLFERLAAGVANPVKERPKVAIVNADDPSAGLFAGVAQEAGARVVTYGTDPGADIRATRVEEDLAGLVVDYVTAAGGGRVRVKLAGRFNVHNALAVVALGEAWELDAAAVRAGIESVIAVPGRMERIDAGQPFQVVVDYAHSPASLALVLDLLAPLAAARGGGLIAVFGSAGERDVDKRAAMGRIAAERCRLVVVTDEDPRGEDRYAILDAIAAGAESAGLRRGIELLLIADRRAAVAAALERARPGDVVLLAGKGHETSIIGPDGAVPWDERSVAREELAALGHQGPIGERS
ncbi:MAG TPA: UDP-N-acetylmuramoyl-L-alanyl-D-glutamate--2,6-diaminopimelate ligase [Candidatus Limnocylindrales bacterium]